ncbi:MAG: hypothetical protein HYU46_01220 [Deltaproteobacteria bacterium]|nr:hypothetical protein [Deltaproteobacteria bacterium]MBI2366478.1 hypothetical protein [Deltaproteobacteria bacterium]MBI2530656.1 hypothetical protein [Deltaproteobacteria bacterium]MBI3067105.1 hypothetical protein [Deltaproteobacteria bacterium]
MQRQLNFLEQPQDPAADVWEQLDRQARKEFVDALARTIAKAVRQMEDEDDR